MAEANDDRYDNLGAPEWESDDAGAPTSGTTPAGYDAAEAMNEKPFGAREIGPGGQVKGA